MSDPRLKIAVFVDFDNIEIGVKSTLGGQFDIGPVLEALKERGEVVSKIAYADWKRADVHSRSLSQHAIKLVQRNLTPGGDKNGADINLALDALEMAFTHDHINAFVIVGGDSDFITLVEKLKQYDKKVFVVGGRAFTSQILQRNCHEFIAYENLVAGGRRAAERGRPAAGQTPVAQAFPLVRRALKVLSDREVSPQLGLLKSTLLQLDSTFSERSYGANSFRDFAEKLSAAGLVALKQTGRSVHVELKDETDGARAQGSGEQAEASASGDGGAAETARQEAPVAASADPERLREGVREVQRLFLAATTTPRWPMYLRNVKQLLRSVDASFDERRFGFTGLMDLLRGCQREGLVRLERDRQGGLRVYPAGLLQQPPAAMPEPAGGILHFPVPGSADTEMVAGPAGAGEAGAREEPAAIAEPAREAAAAEAAAEAPKRRRKTPTGVRRKTSASASSSGARTPRTRTRKAKPAGDA